MNIEKTIYDIAVYAIPVLLAITLHEFSHGWVANKLGDGTARMLGRLTLNPIKHIDPIGTIALPLAMVLMQTGFIFGWAKPIPVNTRNLKNPSKDMAIVAIAGPLSNLFMAILWLILLIIISKLFSGGHGASGVVLGLTQMAMAGVLVNMLLCLFNLVPIPPLDGGRVLSGLVPPNISDLLDKIEPYGIFIILGLFYFRILDISPILGYIKGMVYSFL